MSWFGLWVVYMNVCVGEDVSAGAAHVLQKDVSVYC